jgi:GWxTD domain-containing protein
MTVDPMNIVPHPLPPSTRRRGGRTSPSPVAALAGAVCLLCALFAGCASGGAGNASAGDLTNPLLGPDLSIWLVGPVARLATPQEVQQYLALRDDRQANDFIQQFWDRRNPTKGPGNPVRAAFEERCDVADHKFTEGGVLGRRTDRGTILVLYGPPAKTGFEVPPHPNMGGIEVWDYAAGAPAGLDGKRPDRAYRFIKHGELTVRYLAAPASPTLLPAMPPG